MHAGADVHHASRGPCEERDNPVLLYGYGGFNISATPAYRPQVQAWLEMGGIFAEANLRGGGEYGEAWHQAGSVANKQHVFDDFIAAAEYLIHEHYTRPARLGIHGRSNGGLLVGAVLTQRPELFGAALPAVGVLDMLRYHTASANARQWSSDYGRPRPGAKFRAYAYPGAERKKGMCYPPTSSPPPITMIASCRGQPSSQRPCRRCRSVPIPSRSASRPGAGTAPGSPWMQVDAITRSRSWRAG
jgi:prolyl oligopeptidase